MSNASVRDVVPFHLDLSEAEREEVADAVRTILASGKLILGRYTEAFESAFAERVGVRHAVAVSSGTSALEILLRAHGAAGKRIAVPTNTNFATVASILHVGGLPVYLDMDPATFMPTLAMLEAAHRSYGLGGAVWVHIGGLIAPDFEACVQFCRERGLFMIEDAAHAHGSRVAAGEAGSLADGGAFSFFPTKVMTTMEGGMVTTDDDGIAETARSLRNQGKRGSTFGNDHVDLGSSWRMLEVSAAMGVVQLGKLDGMVERREAGVRGVIDHLSTLGLTWCGIDHMERFSGYKLIVHVPEGVQDDVAGLKRRFRDAGVILGGGVYEKPCHLQPAFESVPHPADGLPVAEAHCPRHICPPITSGTTDEEVVRIGGALEKMLVAG